MSRFSFFAAVVLCSYFSGNSAEVCGQPAEINLNRQDPRIGRQVIITHEKAKLRTPVATVWESYVGEVFTVSLTNGEWMWIAEKGGWLWERDAVPFDTAIETFSQRIAQQKTAQNYHLRGVAYIVHKKYEQAVADFAESLRLEPRNAGALNNRGQVRYLQSDYKAAIKDFTEAITIEANNPVVLNNRALAYIGLDEQDNALADLQAALDLVPQYPEALNNRGVVHQKLDQLDKAVGDFTEALKIYPQYVNALENRSFAYVEMNQYAKAIVDLESAIKFSPKSYQAVNDLAWLLATAPEESIRNKNRALTLAKQACVMSAYKQWNTLDTLAAALAENGQFAEAEKWLETALTLAPEDVKQSLQAHLDQVLAQKPIRD
ncbi:MAG: tetratricopeptide repeat protein [Planctomycetota bacterium]|nr:MAG: tetratricopeptide repeat protein [Planctomycetota bacterium]